MQADVHSVADKVVSSSVASIEESTFEHVAHARERARRILSSESHLGAVDDWRRIFVSARDALIVVWIVWVGFHGFGDPTFTPYFLVSVAAGVALLLGLSTARSTHAQVALYAAEFERERHEVRTDFEHEREEVAALYAAKGFREPLLSQVVDVLCADEDRLLKVMMEEELGLFMYHVSHPVLVGVWNFGAALATGLILALPTVWLSADATHHWMPAASAIGLVALSLVSAKTAQGSFVEVAAVNVLSALVTGGTVYFLTRWMAAWI